MIAAMPVEVATAASAQTPDAQDLADGIREALDLDPGLQELAFSNNVIPATPTPTSHKAVPPSGLAGWPAPGAHSVRIPSRKEPEESISWRP